MAFIIYLRELMIDEYGRRCLGQPVAIFSCRGDGKTAWFEITNDVTEKLENKISDNKLKALHALMNAKFTLKELNDNLNKLSFTEEEINMVVNHAGIIGKIEFNNNSNDIWTVNDPDHPCYKDKRVILDETDKEKLIKLLNEPIYLTAHTDSSAVYTEQKTLSPWHSETIKYILEDAIPNSFPTIFGWICKYWDKKPVWELESDDYMIIYLYEDMVLKDGLRCPNYNRLIGEVRCRGDGTPGRIKFYDTCEDLWIVQDVNHPCYTNKIQILDETCRSLVAGLFYDYLYITTGGGWTDGVHYTEGKTSGPWHRETLLNIVNFRLRASLGGGNIHAEIIRDNPPPPWKPGDDRLIYLYENIVTAGGNTRPGRLAGKIIYKGDGTPGNITFYDICNEIAEINDK
ncbi:MAG: hypothetical protein ABRQ39_27785, partial [Candidatus Eremiobacterota bacterium]